MEYRNIPNIDIENAHLMFKNFQGLPSKYNRAGDRNFRVRIDDQDTAVSLHNDGWNINVAVGSKDRQDAFISEGWNPQSVKLWPSLKDDDSTVFYMKVKVSFDVHPKIPPMRVFLHTSKSAVRMDEESIGSLDSLELKNVDLTIRPYQWEVDGMTGVSGYLSVMHTSYVEDRWAAKYAEEEAPIEESDEDLPF